MSNVSSFSTYGLTNIMESDINRNWPLATANKNFYMSSMDQHLYASPEAQHDVMGHNDHWSSYGYPLPTYSNFSYHGYGHQYEGVDVIPKTSFIMPSQQLYSSSWHVPYADSTHNHVHNANGHGGHYGQKYYPTAFKEAPYLATESVKSSNDIPSSSEYFSPFSSSTTNAPSPLSQSQGRNHNINSAKSLSVIQKNPAYDSSRDTYQGPAATSNHLDPRGQELTERTIIQHTKNAVPSQSCLHVSEGYKQSTEKCTRPLNVSTSLPASNHVKKQERKMKKILHELLKTNSSKASQLLDFYRYHYTVIEQRYCSELKSGIYPSMASQGEIDFQLLQLIQQVHQQLGMMGYQKNGMSVINRKNALNTEVRKTRLLPKRSVKILETWFEENLSNPYPSRDQTLHLAMDCELTVEQIRKWFANKRNRSRNNKLYK